MSRYLQWAGKGSYQDSGEQSLNQVVMCNLPNKEVVC
jgi:hypothetical protein